MKRHIYWFSAGAILASLCLSVLPVGGQENEATSDLMRRYAEANLKLAELQLNNRLEANKSMPQTYSDLEIARSRANVATAAEQLRLAAKPSSDAVELHVRRALEKARIAETEYHAALEAEEKLPGSYDSEQLEEFRLRSEVAQFRLAIWRSPNTGMLSLLDHIHWQLERVSEDVIELQHRMDKLKQ